MSKTLLIAAVLLLTLAAIPTWAGPRSKGTGGSYVVENPNHTQSLGGKSSNASRGLQNASGRSKAVEADKGVIDDPGGVKK